MKASEAVELSLRKLDPRIKQELNRIIRERAGIGQLDAIIDISHLCNDTFQSDLAKSYLMKEGYKVDDCYHNRLRVDWGRAQQQTINIEL